MKKKIVCISDPETKILLNFMGINVLVVDHNDDKTFIDYINELLLDPDVGLIVINERMFVRNREFVLKVKLENVSPIIVEIPSLVGATKKDYTLQMLKEIIGLEA